MLCHTELRSGDISRATPTLAARPRASALRLRRFAGSRKAKAAAFGGLSASSEISGFNVGLGDAEHAEEGRFASNLSSSLSD